MQNSATALTLLAVSTGRSGTTTLWQYIQKLCDMNAQGKRSLHETHAIQVYEGIIQYIREGDDLQLVKTLGSWEHFAEIGNGHAFCMPVVHKVFGPKLKLIHLQREREATVKSLERNFNFNPTMAGGYVDADIEFKLHRPTAVDCGDMSAKEWSALSLLERCAWYYDKTHQLVDEHAHLFENHMHLKTEDLNTPKTQAEITHFIDPSWRAADHMPHLNRWDWVDYEKMTPEQRPIFENYFAYFDWNRFFSEQYYPPSYFLRLMIEYTKSNPSDHLAKKFLSSCARELYSTCIALLEQQPEDEALKQQVLEGLRDASQALKKVYP